MITETLKSRPHTPQYRRHKATGQAYVELNGRRFYLGRHELASTRQKYHRLIAEWEANDRQPHVAPEDITIVEVADHFWKHAKAQYRGPDGSLAGELDNFRYALRPLLKLYGPTKAGEFGPRALKTVRQKLVEAGLARTYVNRQILRIRSVFRWAVEEELIPAHVYQGLMAVRGLHRGRTEARETDPVKPVPEELVAAIQPFVSRQVWAMVQVQLRTGARPDEVVRLRPINFTSRTGDIWTVRYDQHKTAHHGCEKVIYFGPQAQRIIGEFIGNRPVNTYLFSPSEAEEERRQKLHASRSTPLSCGNRPGTNRKANRVRAPRDHYDVDTYRRAIQRGCEQAFPPPDHLTRRKVKGLRGQRWETQKEWKTRMGADGWRELKAWNVGHSWSPGQLRHNAATFLRAEFGIEVSQVVLGHRLGSSITEIYAEPNVRRALERFAELVSFAKTEAFVDGPKSARYTRDIRLPLLEFA